MTNDPWERAKRRADRRTAASGSVAPSAQGTPQTAAVWQLLPALIIICVGLYAYHNSLRGAFVFDDLFTIRDNPTIRQLWPPRRALSPPQANNPVSGRPVVNLSLAVNYALGGLNVWGYHVVNLAIHLLGALVLYGVVRRTLLCPSLRERYGDGARWLALAVALVWVVHPLQTESVTYLTQRTESLMGLFFLLTLYCVTRGATSSRQRGWYAAAIVFCALGMGSKQVMVVAPLAVLLYDRAFLSGSFREALRARTALYAGLCGCWLVLVGLVASSSQGNTGFGLSVTPWEYARTQPGVIFHYLRLSFWPSPLVIDYEDWPVAKTLAMWVPSAAVVLALLVATLWAVRRRPYLGFLGGWFFLILAPSSSVLPSIGEFAAERRMYLPLAAVIALVVIGWHMGFAAICGRLGWGSGRRRVVEMVVLVATVAALAQLTVRRNEDYRSEVALWTDAVEKRPDNARGHYNLGIALAAQGKLDEAIAQISEALRINPADAEVHNNLGIALTRKGKIEEAIAHYSEALRINPNFAEAHTNLGNALFRQGKIDEAITHYSQALRIAPSAVHYDFATALAREGRTQEAVAHLEAALKLDPGFEQARRALAQLTSFSGKDESQLQSAGSSGVPMRDSVENQRHSSVEVGAKVVP